MQNYLTVAQFFDPDDAVDIFERRNAWGTSGERKRGGRSRHGYGIERRIAGKFEDRPSQRGAAP